MARSIKSRVPHIQSSTLKGLPEVLARFHIPVTQILAPYRLKPQILTVRNHFIPYETYAAILHDSAIACRAPHFGLLLSRASAHDPSSAGMLGMLLKRCATIGEAARALLRYYHSLSEGAAYKLITKGRRAFLVREGLVSGLQHDRILQDLSLADFEMMLRRANDPGWRATKIHFTCDRPADLRPYRATFDCPLEFGAKMQAIEFATSKLDERIATSDPVLEQLLRDVVSGSLTKHGRRFSNAVTEAIDALLPTGLCCVNAIADIFGMHSRTLHRQLGEEGKVFEIILDDRRRTHAESYLINTSMPLADIASALGYGAPGVFTRAFRRWFGIAPSAFRSQNAKPRR